MIRKKHQNEVNCVVSGEIYTAGKKFHTPVGSDGRDKYHLCVTVQKSALSLEKFLVANCTQVYFNKHKRNAFVRKCKTVGKLEFP